MTYQGFESWLFKTEILPREKIHYHDKNCSRMIDILPSFPFCFSQMKLNYIFFRDINIKMFLQPESKKWAKSHVKRSINRFSEMHGNDISGIVLSVISCLSYHTRAPSWSSLGSNSLDRQNGFYPFPPVLYTLKGHFVVDY
ncbi:hypothetical protein [Candidatus Lokiarchaeum ossiferum]|uniref:hypothetical protein n=1 Tax=Candidatus Lokiarchaeum ossiferum TaxID=2951803 RepID=UPI00352FA14C